MKKHKGFTVVELLIVIVIIGILAAISIVSYNGVSQKAREAAAKQNSSQIERQIMIYATQNGEPVSISGTMIGYLDKPGTTNLATPITGATDITTYMVYETKRTSDDYYPIAYLTPEQDSNRFRWQSGPAGSSSLNVRADIPGQANSTTYVNDARVTGKTIVGWAQTSDSVRTQSIGFNQATVSNTRSLPAGANWNFTSMYSGDRSESGIVKAFLVFNSSHDQNTRQQIINWLAQKYNVAL